MRPTNRTKATIYHLPFYKRSTTSLFRVYNFVFFFFVINSIYEFKTYLDVRLTVPTDTSAFCRSERTASIERCFSVFAIRNARKWRTDVKICFSTNWKRQVNYFRIGFLNSKRLGASIDQESFRTNRSRRSRCCVFIQKKKKKNSVRWRLGQRKSTENSTETATA